MNRNEAVLYVCLSDGISVIFLSLTLTITHTHTRRPCLCLAGLFGVGCGSAVPAVARAGRAGHGAQLLERAKEAAIACPERGSALGRNPASMAYSLAGPTQQAQYMAHQDAARHIAEPTEPAAECEAAKAVQYCRRPAAQESVSARRKKRRATTKTNPLFHKHQE